jgi:hypothetical protein
MIKKTENYGLRIGSFNDRYMPFFTVFDPLISENTARPKGVRVMGLNVNFNGISVISWRSVLSVEEIGVPGENH